MLGSLSQVKTPGRALLSVREGDKHRVVDLAAKLLRQGFELDATHGTAVVLGKRVLIRVWSTKCMRGVHTFRIASRMASIPIL